MLDGAEIKKKEFYGMIRHFSVKMYSCVKKSEYPLCVSILYHISLGKEECKVT